MNAKKEPCETAHSKSIAPKLCWSGPGQQMLVKASSTKRRLAARFAMAFKGFGLGFIGFRAAGVCF